MSTERLKNLLDKRKAKRAPRLTEAIATMEPTIGPSMRPEARFKGEEGRHRTIIREFAKIRKELARMGFKVVMNESILNVISAMWNDGLLVIIQQTKRAVAAINGYFHIPFVSFIFEGEITIGKLFIVSIVIYKRAALRQKLRSKVFAVYQQRESITI